MPPPAVLDSTDLRDPVFATVKLNHGERVALRHTALKNALQVDCFPLAPGEEVATVLMGYHNLTLLFTLELLDKLLAASTGGRALPLPVLEEETSENARRALVLLSYVCHLLFNFQIRGRFELFVSVLHISGGASSNTLRARFNELRKLMKPAANEGAQQSVLARTLELEQGGEPGSLVLTLLQRPREMIDISESDVDGPTNDSDADDMRSNASSHRSSNGITTINVNVQRSTPSQAASAPSVSNAARSGASKPREVDSTGLGRLGLLSSPWGSYLVQMAQFALVLVTSLVILLILVVWGIGAGIESLIGFNPVRWLPFASRVSHLWELGPITLIFSFWISVGASLVRLPYYASRTTVRAYMISYHRLDHRDVVTYLTEIGLNLAPDEEYQFSVTIWLTFAIFGIIVYLVSRCAGPVLNAMWKVPKKLAGWYRKKRKEWENQREARRREQEKALAAAERAAQKTTRKSSRTDPELKSQPPTKSSRIIQGTARLRSTPVSAPLKSTESATASESNYAVGTQSQIAPPTPTIGTRDLGGETRRFTADPGAGAWLFEDAAGRMACLPSPGEYRPGMTFPDTVTGNIAQIIKLDEILIKTLVSAGFSLVAILSGRKEAITLMEAMRAKYGMEPLVTKIMIGHYVYGYGRWECHLDPFNPFTWGPEMLRLNGQFQASVESGFAAFLEKYGLVLGMSRDALMNNLPEFCEWMRKIYVRFSAAQKEEGVLSPFGPGLSSPGHSPVPGMESLITDFYVERNFFGNLLASLRARSPASHPSLASNIWNHKIKPLISLNVWVPANGFLDGQFTPFKHVFDAFKITPLQRSSAGNPEVASIACTLCEEHPTVYASKVSTGAYHFEAVCPLHSSLRKASSLDEKKAGKTKKKGQGNGSEE